MDDPGVQAVIEQVKEQIALRSGDVKTTDLWGRRRFAYEIDHKHEGYYVVLEFVAEGTGPRRARALAPARGRRSSATS